MRLQLDWPVRNGSKPVTTALNQAILRAAAGAASTECPTQVAALDVALAHCGTAKQWRQDYRTVMEKFVLIQAAASTETVVNMCRAGLECASSSFLLRSDETEETMTLADAMAQVPQQALETLTYTTPQNEVVSKNAQFRLASPHGTPTNPIWLTGEDAVAQLEAWSEYGCMEESALTHASAVCRSSHVTEFVTDKIFCLLGVTSEMGPTTHLLSIPGAHVMGVARAGTKLEALATWFAQHAAPGVTLQMAPANLLEHMVDIAQWIVTTAHQAAAGSTNGRPPTLVLMPLAYMDGEANVRLTVAMDAIVQYVLQHYDTVALAYLTSPTTIYTIPPDAAVDAHRRYQANESSALTWTRLARTVSLGQWYQPSNTWTQLGDTDATSRIVYNGAHVLQGPNYCLAKLMQQWRCMVERYDRGIPVSAPHAPVTRTESVLHNPSAAKALEGMPFFAPMITFDVLPCSSLLTAIVLHQLYETTHPTIALSHPLELFWDGSVHGGSWRCPYRSDSLLTLIFLLGHTAPSGWCPEAALAPPPSPEASDLPV